MAATKLGTTGLGIHDDNFYGMYRGKVLSNTDSSQLGRIKVQIYPMLADITDTDLLPWAVPAYPIWDGSGSGVGYFAVPDVDTFVFTFFEAGNIYQPVYFAEAPTATLGLPSDRTTSYPNTKVRKSSSGITYITDDTLKQSIIKTAGGIVSTIDDIASTVKLEHPTGTYILVSADGGVTIHSIKDVVVNAVNAEINTSVNADVVATGNVNISGAIVNITGGTSVNINPT